MQSNVWPELQGFDRPPVDFEARERIAVFLLFIGASLWLVRIALENKKWNRLSKMQSDLYNKLLDKCSTNEELLAFFRDSAGKPFFDLAAIEPRTANPMSRVFLPLQFGIVLTLTGGGFLFLRHSGAPTEHDAGILLGLGTLIFTLGFGLIISAAVSYFVARHLGLLPQPGKASETNARS